MCTDWDPVAKALKPAETCIESGFDDNWKLPTVTHLSMDVGTRPCEKLMILDTASNGREWGAQRPPYPGS